MTMLLSASTTFAILSACIVLSTLPSSSAFQVGSQGRVMWEDNCDFKGSELRAARGIPDVCGDMCAADAACSHWSWNNYNGGTCWLKQGGAGTRKSAYGTNCGYVVGRFGDRSKQTTTTTTASSSNNGLNAVESQTMLNNINAYRSQNGLAGLRVDQRLNSASYAHSQDQASRCQMTHDGRDGSKAWDRMKAKGYKMSTAAENVAAGQQSVESVMNSWWNSAGHRANILNDKVKDVGFAKAVNNGCSTYKIYWTQDFGSTSA